MGTEEQAKTPEQRLDALEEAISTLLDMVESLSKKVTEVDKRAVKKSTGLFGGKRTKTAIKDTTTGTIYPSKANLGKKLAAEFGLDPGNSFVYYQVILKAPDRFADASAEEAEKSWEAERAQREKEVAEANKRMQAEEEAKKKAEAEAAKKTK